MTVMVYIWDKQKHMSLQTENYYIGLHIIDKSNMQLNPDRNSEDHFVWTVKTITSLDQDSRRLRQQPDRFYSFDGLDEERLQSYIQVFPQQFKSDDLIRQQSNRLNESQSMSDSSMRLQQIAAHERSQVERFEGGLRGFATGLSAVMKAVSHAVATKVVLYAASNDEQMLARLREVQSTFEHPQKLYLLVYDINEEAWFLASNHKDSFKKDSLQSLSGEFAELNEQMENIDYERLFSDDLDDMRELREQIESYAEAVIKRYFMGADEKSVEHSEIFKDKLAELSKDEKKLLYSVKGKSGLDKGFGNQGITVNYIIMMLLSVGGFGKVLNVSGLHNLIHYPDLEHGGIEQHERERYIARCFHVVDCRSFSIAFLVAEMILFFNYFLDLDALGKAALISALPLGCLIYCCFLAAGAKKMPNRDHDDRFKNMAYLTQFAHDLASNKRALKNITTSDDNSNALDDVAHVDEPGVVWIRIWLPKKQGEVGHVSMETQNMYASYWPKQATKTALFASTESDFHTLTKDILAEQRNPDRIIRLESLDTSAMEDSFSLFQSSDRQWGLLGSSIVKNQKMQNCCGLVWSLLKSGGMDLKLSRITAPVFDITLCCSCLTMGLIVSYCMYYPIWKSNSFDREGNFAILNVFGVIALCFLIYPLKHAISALKQTLSGSGVAFTPSGIEALLSPYHHSAEASTEVSVALEEDSDVRSVASEFPEDDAEGSVKVQP